MPIRVLPSTLVNQIAAGEVIERPSSVVKELVENAIDAGASSIEVTLVDGGKSLIVIADNGKGMGPDELPLAVERHATSKLPDDDLFNIQFLGFRGEALPSIASVARMSIVSRTKDAENAWKIEVNGGQKSEVMPAAHPKGTRIEVRDLFYATPARLKFLKASTSETAQCVDMLNRIAMANPHISFYLTADNKKKISLNACQGELFDARLSRLAEVMGREFGENSLLINAERENVRISGFVSLPTLNKANSLSQYLFVNDRPVRDKLLLGAIKGAYQDVLASNRYPMCALFFDVDPAFVDVNVHPAKAEVRFYDNALVRGLLVSSIRNALSQGAERAANTLDVEAFVQDSIPSFGQTVLPDTAVLQEHTQQPVRSFYQSIMPIPHTAPRRQAELPALERAYSVKVENPTVMCQNADTEGNIGHLGLAKAQFHDTYIIAQSEDSIVIVDQHAAHERVLYEKILQSMKTREFTSQMISPPIILNLTMQESDLLKKYMDRFTRIGFEFEEFGQESYAVRAVPGNLFHIAKKELLLEMLDSLSDEITRNHSSDLIDEKIASMSCKAAVKGNMRLTAQEADALIGELLTLENPYHCPHGRPTIIAMSKRELEKKFKRIV